MRPPRPCSRCASVSADSFLSCSQKEALSVGLMLERSSDEDTQTELRDEREGEGDIWRSQKRGCGTKSLEGVWVTSTSSDLTSEDASPLSTPHVNHNAAVRKTHEGEGEVRCVAPAVMDRAQCCGLQANNSTPSLRSPCYGSVFKGGGKGWCSACSALANTVKSVEGSAVVTFSTVRSSLSCAPIAPSDNPLIPPSMGSGQSPTHDQRGCQHPLLFSQREGHREPSLIFASGVRPRSVSLLLHSDEEESKMQ